MLDNKNTNIETSELENSMKTYTSYLMLIYSSLFTEKMVEIMEL